MFLLQQFFAVKRACGVQLEPRSYAVQVEAMIVVTGQLDYEWVLVYADAISQVLKLTIGSLGRATYLQGMGSRRLGRCQKASALSSAPAPIHPGSCLAPPSVLWADRRHSRGASRSYSLTDPRVRCSRPPVVRAWSRKHWRASGRPPPCFRAAVKHWHLCARWDPTCPRVQAARRRSRGLVGARVAATCRLRWRCCVRLSGLAVMLRTQSLLPTFVARHGGGIPDVASPD